MGFDLHQEQKQKLAITTQMKQAIDVLRFTGEELSEWVEEFALANPFVEVSPRTPSSTSQKPHSASHSSAGGGDAARAIEQRVPVRETMTDAIALQVRLLSNDPKVTRVALFLTGLLDDSGYLRESDEELVALSGADRATVQAAVALLQDVEPAGIGARNLHECLLLQLRQVPSEQRALAEAVVRHHLEDVAAHKFSKIATALHVDVEDVRTSVAFIKDLNPRPGLVLGDMVPQHIIPDVVVKKIDGVFRAIDSDWSLSRVHVNRSYVRMFDSAPDLATKQFLRQHLQSASWLNHCLEKRQATVLRVAGAIVSRQQAFFEAGPRALEPMTLRQIAEQLELHESTISRAVRGKYMDTPQGVLEFKYFFTAELKAEGGAISTQAAKQWIRNLIAEEDATRPLSDEELAKRLREQGIPLARRTVAKYREELNIPTSKQRRRYE
ncbi:RNA polymerase factor sigma-54 [Alicyclobacillus fastidiosus]|uniref:RNA polymerase factor sigma-54 n=1 Tax=Alicyclobacillus fastidiosus TaxID=392011 RepID=A0ABV5AGE7_9BACL|nr:RNA polymerase factor sigma-54 [Alicyclobacillus fastidiosus]WEH12137.1 RNA polymerase factor sigma-54 [Alicyclobacillus fastidiosus]